MGFAQGRRFELGDRLPSLGEEGENDDDYLQNGEYRRDLDGENFRRLIERFSHRNSPVYCPTNFNGVFPDRFLNNRTNLFSGLGLYYASQGHISPIFAAAQKLLPVPSLTTDKLFEANYLARYNQVPLLTDLGCHALLMNHIVPSQLSQLQLYPMQLTSVDLPILIQAGYIKQNCMPTVLGHSAIRSGYLNPNFAANFDCSYSDRTEITREHLTDAGYVHKASGLLTQEALTGAESHFLPLEFYKNLGLYPYNFNQNDNNVVDDSNSFGSSFDRELQNLKLVGYTGHNFALTQLAVHAIQRNYLNINYFRYLKLWPYPQTPTIQRFINANYVDYHGRLTDLGLWAYRYQYLTRPMLVEAGVNVGHHVSIFMPNSLKVEHENLVRRN